MVLLSLILQQCLQYCYYWPLLCLSCLNLEQYSKRPLVMQESKDQVGSCNDKTSEEKKNWGPCFFNQVANGNPTVRNKVKQFYRHSWTLLSISEKNLTSGPVHSILGPGLPVLFLELCTRIIGPTVPVSWFHFSRNSTVEPNKNCTLFFKMFSMFLHQVQSSFHCYCTFFISYWLTRFPIVDKFSISRKWHNEATCISCVLPQKLYTIKILSSILHCTQYSCYCPIDSNSLLPLYLVPNFTVMFPHQVPYFLPFLRCST
jgi:hypothetical protein